MCKFWILCVFLYKFWLFWYTVNYLINTEWNLHGWGELIIPAELVGIRITCLFPVALYGIFNAVIITVGVVTIVGYIVYNILLVLFCSLCSPCLFAYFRLEDHL